MSEDFLTKIVQHKKETNSLKKGVFENIRKNLEAVTFNRYRIFHRALSQGNDIHLIAEIKKASPSKGLIREDFDAFEIAKIYVANKASALSILTEEKYFLGSHKYIRKVRDHFNTPILMKDFVIDSNQIYEAQFYGASAILLIAAILDNKKLEEFHDIASSLDLDCLVEVHDEEELKRVLDLPFDIIGINNRNLKDFVVDIKTCERLIPKIPKKCIVVAESGIQSHEEVLQLKKMGAHAVLIGETFMRAKNIDQKIKEVMYGKKS